MTHLPPATTLRKISATLAICLALAMATSMTATAQPSQDNGRGTVKIHDDPDADPDTRNEPHVSCDFYVEGFNFRDGEGWLVFLGWPPTGDKSEVTPTGDDLDWTGTPDGDGEFDFEKGAYQLPPGHYRLEVYTDDGHPGHDGHFAKAKMFWVDECEGEEPPGGGLGCPPDVAVTANGNETVTLTWGAVANATSYNVYRGVSDGDIEYLATVAATEFLDDDVDGGTSYTYVVTAFDGKDESRGCDEITTMAIPFFTNPVVGALALLGGLGAFAMLRRRG